MIGAGGSGNLTNGFNGNIVDSALTNVNLGSVLNVTLADNGGLTLTHALIPDSRALGAGDQSICDAAPISNRDQRDEIRPQGNAACDIGAFESDLL